MPTNAKTIRIQRAAAIVAAGQTLKETARLLQRHYNTVRKWARTPLFQETLERIHRQSQTKVEDLAADVAVKMKLAAEQALDFQYRTLNDPDAPLQIKIRISDSLMERDVRMSKKRQLAVKQPHEILIPEILARTAATSEAILRAEQKSTSGRRILPSDGSPERGD